MRRKFLILVISLLLIPIVMMIGQSSWVIIGEKTTNIDSKYYPFDINWYQKTTYNGQEQQITVTPDEGHNYNECTYTYYDSESNLLSGNPTNAGTYYCDVAYNTEQIAYVEFVINKKPLTITANSNSITYGDILSGNGVTYSGFVEGEDESVLEGKLSYTSNYDNSNNTSRDAGTYDLIPTGLSSKNYEITFVKNTLNVNKKNTEFTWSNLELVYNGQEQQPSCNMNTTLYGDSTAITVNGKGKDVGSYNVNISNNLKNYNLVENATNSYNSTFNITERTIDASWSTTNTFVYDGNQKTVEVTLNDGNTSNEISTITGETVTPIIQYSLKDANSWTETAPTNAGTYDVKIVGFKVNGSVTNNYVINSTTATTTMTINKADIDMSGVSFSNQTISYDGKSHTLEVSGTLPAGITSVTYTNDKGTTPGNQLTDPGSIVITAHFNVDDNHNSVSDMKATLTITNKKKVKFTISGGTYTYDGKSHPAEIITYVDGVESTLPSGITTTVVYKAGTSNSATAPKDAGTYEIIFNAAIGSTVNDLYELEKDNTINNNGKIIINPMKIKLSGDTIEIDYNSAKRTWKTLAPDISSQIKFLDSNDKVLTSFTNFSFDSMTNGEYEYSSSSTANIVGSTYLGSVSLTSTNYELIDSNENTVLIKYKTAKIGKTFYTVEDAINNGSGTIIFAGDASGAATYVTTSFCSLTKLAGNPYSSNTYTIKSRSLIVPYEASENEYNATDTSGSTSGNVYSALIIPSSITINLNGTSSFVAGANIGYNMSVSATYALHRGVIMNYGTVNVASGCSVKGYGYIKGTGTINLESGATAIDCMSVYDFPGGTATTGMVRDVFPINAWSIHNISCDTIIYAGATLDVFAYFVLRSSPTKAGANIIGTKSASNCLYKIYDGYIKKSASNAVSSPSDTALTSIIGRNQVKGQRDKIEIYGTCEDASMKISVGSASLETNKSKSLPIGYMDIVVGNASRLSLNNSDYMFHPGSSFIIESGAKVIIGSGVDFSTISLEVSNANVSTRGFYKYCIDKFEPKIIINGTLESSGNIGLENIVTTEEGAILNLSSSAVSATFKTMNSESNGSILNPSGYYYSGTTTSTGIVDATSTTLSKKSYISVKSGDSCYWTAATNVSQFTINFYDSDKTTLLATKTIQSVSSTTYTITGNEYTTSKKYYNFAGWLRKSDDESCVSTILNANDSIDLYATYSPIEYTINYSEQFAEERITCESEKYSQNLPNITKDGYVFMGWYVIIGENEKLATSYYQVVEGCVLVGWTEITLTAKWSDSYTISFDKNNDEYEDTNSKLGVQAFERIDSISSSTLTLPSLTENDEIVTKTKYFVGWMDAANGNTITNIDSYDWTSLFGTGKAITLYAKWESKYEINCISYLDDVKEIDTTIYTKPGSVYDLSEYSKPKNYKSGRNYEIEIYINSSKVSVDGSYLNEMNFASNCILEIKHYTLYTISYSSNNSHISSQSVLVDGTKIGIGTISVRYNSIINVSATPKKGISYRTVTISMTGCTDASSSSSTAATITNKKVADIADDSCVITITINGSW